MRVMGWQRLGTAAYPSAFGVAYVLLSFAEFPTPTGDLLRPLILVVLGSITLVAILAVVLRGIHRAALVASILLVGLSAPFLLVAVVAAALTWTLLNLARGRWTIRSLLAMRAEQASRGARVFAVALAVVALALAAPSIAGGIYLVDRQAGTPSAAAPEIIVLLLDGYPRTDTLARVYGSDNAPFEAALEEMGFVVSRGSRANYPHTWLTFTSMLQGRYLDEVPQLAEPAEAAAEQYRRLMASLNDSRMPAQLRTRGYEVAVIPSPFRSVALQTADRYLDSGQMSAFEYSLIAHSQLAGVVTTLVPDFFMAQQRDRFHASLDRIVAVAGEEAGRPTFLLAHLFSPPHAPLVYGSSGEHLPLPDCVPAECALWEFPEEAWDGLDEQIHYANGEILEALGEVIQREPNTTIVLLSDHGSRRDRRDLDEYFHTFFAARTVDGTGFPDDVSPVNVVRLLLGEDELAYRAWMFAHELEPLVLAPYAPAP